MVNIGNVNNQGSERRGLSFLVFVGIIGFSIARGVATFFTNYLWFDSVNLNDVWVKILLTRLGLVAATTTIAFLFIFTNLRFIQIIATIFFISIICRRHCIFFRFDFWFCIFFFKYLLDSKFTDC